jgi:hypothetical protein
VREPFTIVNGESPFMTFRHIARVGAAGLFAAGILAAAAVPAYAADVDFGVGFKGTTIAADASGKLGFVNLTNGGSSTPAKVNVLFDVTKLDQDKVAFPDPGDCTLAAGVYDCPVPAEAIPGPGGTTDLPVPLIRQKGATGAAGKLTVSVVVAGDTQKDNDSATVDVSVGGHGVDLGLVVPDVTLLDADGDLTGKPIPPGGSSEVQGLIINWGDTTSTGLHVTIALPKDVTFPDVEGCTVSADKRTVDCVADDLPLTPVDQEPSGDDVTSIVNFAFPVTVSADAKGPVTLTGGEATVAATGQESLPEPVARKLARKAVLPKGFHRLTAVQAAAAVEVDPSDNTDGFAVLVAAKPVGSGGGNGGGTGEGGGLPVTGPVAASVAGAGAVVIAIGAVLFVATRRRRVVLVTPADEN